MRAEDGPHYDAPRRKTKTAFPALAGAAVAVCGGLGFSVCSYFESAVSPLTYQQIKIGDTQDTVRELTGGDSMTARTAGRFCFHDAKLAQKVEIRTS